MMNVGIPPSAISASKWSTFTKYLEGPKATIAKAAKAAGISPDVIARYSKDISAKLSFLSPDKLKGLTAELRGMNLRTVVQRGAAASRTFNSTVGTRAQTAIASFSKAHLSPATHAKLAEAVAKGSKAAVGAQAKMSAGYARASASVAAKTTSGMQWLKASGGSGAKAAGWLSKIAAPFRAVGRAIAPMARMVPVLNAVFIVSDSVSAIWKTGKAMVGLGSWGAAGAQWAKAGLSVGAALPIPGASFVFGGARAAWGITEMVGGMRARPA